MTPLRCLTLHFALLLILPVPALYPAVAVADSFTGEALPGSFLHVVKPGDSLIAIAALYRDSTRHYCLADLLADIRRANSLDSSLIRPGRRLLIPTDRTGSFPVARERVSDGAPMRGIYLTGPACGTGAVFELVDRFLAVGGNGVVFDAKDIDGGVTFASRQPLAAAAGHRCGGHGAAPRKARGGRSRDRRGARHRAA